MNATGNTDPNATGNTDPSENDGCLPTIVLFPFRVLRGVFAMSFKRLAMVVTMLAILVFPAGVAAQDVAPAPIAVHVVSFTVDNDTYSVDVSGWQSLPPVILSDTTAEGVSLLSARQCKLTGNGNNVACVCKIGNRWRGAPMWMCR